MNVSVIIPNYNRAELVGQTIRNMLEQTLPPHEVIVVDDGSTDDSVAVIRAFGNRVRLIQQANQGPGAARNAGLAVASGEFIQFMDSDDLASRNKLEVQATLMSSTGADFVYGPWVKGRIVEQTFRPENVVLQQRPLPDRLPLHAWVLRGLSIVFQACLLRRKWMEKVGGYRTDLMPSEDTELLFRIGMHQARMAFSPTCLTLYRLHPGAQITDSGTGRGDRLVDWGRLRLFLHEQCQISEAGIDATTCWLALCELWDVRRWLGRLGVAAPDLELGLREAVPRGVVPLCWLYKQWERAAGWGQQVAVGHRWKSFYQASALTPQQVQLIAGLGLHVTSSCQAAGR